VSGDITTFHPKDDGLFCHIFNILLGSKIICYLFIGMGKKRLQGLNSTVGIIYRVGAFGEVLIKIISLFSRGVFYYWLKKFLNCADSR
jgi:hypothetical protein